jgi:tripartite-type tricarboxylate transporter receptor subunit TctC
MCWADTFRGCRFTADVDGLYPGRAAEGPGQHRLTPRAADSDVPTIGESLPGFELPTWYAVWLPAGTPVDIVDKLHGAIAEALKLDEVQKRVIAIGFNPAGGSRAEFTEYTKKETEKYAKLIQTLGLKPQ